MDVTGATSKMTVKKLNSEKKVEGKIMPEYRE